MSTQTQLAPWNCTTEGLENASPRHSNSFTELERKVLDRFFRYLPQNPYCANAVNRGLRIMDRVNALRYENVQLGKGASGKAGLAYIPVDYDGPDLAIGVAAACIPPPTIIITNPNNGHSHGLWELEIPVSKHNAKGLAYADATRRALTAAIGADQAYAGWMIHNPLHSRWAVSIIDRRYKLAELARCVKLARRHRELIVGDSGNALGRNDELFHTLRRYAYERVKSVDDETLFAEEIEAQALSINEQFRIPLPRSEVRSTARSVCRYAWEHRKVFRKLHANRGACGYAPMGLMEVNKRQAEVTRRRRGSAARTSAVRADATKAEIREAIISLRQDGSPVTKAAVARIAGVSDRMLRRRYADLFEESVALVDTHSLPVATDSLPGTSVLSEISGGAVPVADCQQLAAAADNANVSDETDQRRAA